MQKKLSLIDAIMFVMGSMIGSGIFIVSSDMMRNLGSGLWIIIVWLITAVMTVAAAITYGELSAMFPQAGGQYTYIKEIYGKLVGFLYGWGLFAVIQTGTIAAVAMAFGKFTAYLVPALNNAAPIIVIGAYQITWIQILSIIVILLLTYVNTKGVQSGKIVQLLFTLSKIAALLGLIILGFIFAKDSYISSNISWDFVAFKNIDNQSWIPISGMNLLGGIAAAMVGAVFSSVAWESVTFVSSEIDNPKKNVLKSMIFGTSLVMVLYVLVNLVYLNALDRDAIAFAANDRVAVVASQSIFGTSGTVIIAILVMISTFGCNNGLIFSGARVLQTMARDGMFFSAATRNNHNHVPSNALWMQGAWASLLCLSGQYGNLLDMISLVIVLFYMLTVFGVIYLRIKKPDLNRPYKTWLYPVTPILYLILGAAFCVLLIIYKPLYTWPGLILVLLGWTIYYFIKKNNNRFIG